MSARKARSRKRSGASSKQPEAQPTFFVDECLGRHTVVDALRTAGAQVVAHHECFPPGVPDAEWLPVIGRRGYLLLTKDKNLRRRFLELQAIVDAGVRAFVLTGGELSGHEQAAVLVRSLRRMVRLGAKPGPFIARITRMGQVHIIVTRRNLKRWRG